MNFDLRLPLGLLFSTLGVILAIFGLLSSPTLYQRCFGLNINLIWGLAILAFGAAMLTLALRARRTSGSHS